MSLDNYLTQDGVMLDIAPTSKKQLFQFMAERLVKLPAVADKDMSARDVVHAIMDRERLGSTGVGSGVALPHARLDNIDTVHAVFARLETPIDYESIDDIPVDLVVLLVAPKDAGGAHLRALAQFSRRLRREDMRARLRAAPDLSSVFVSINTQASAA
ncbi:PTS sugar transporter subunit IIA [Fretibacter rubidus]|uniref:PTS sugar transporter subunit IIA n=1 Tax=Fretibacter rubidus TaxID=570162 RepID=UPI00352B6291